MAGHEVIGRWVDTFNRGDLDGFGQTYAPDAVLYLPIAPDGIQGRGAIVQHERALAEAFSEMVLEVSPVLSGGDRLAVEWEFRGKHTAPLVLPDQTVAPTNNSLSLEGGSFLRINGEGQIAEERRLYDPNSLFEQLGMKPQAASR